MVHTGGNAKVHKTFLGKLRESEKKHFFEHIFLLTSIALEKYNNLLEDVPVCLNSVLSHFSGLVILGIKMVHAVGKYLDFVIFLFVDKTPHCCQNDFRQIRNSFFVFFSFQKLLRV